MFRYSVGEGVLAVLVEVLETNSTIRFLDLHWCEIGDMGAGALANILTDNQLVRLQLDNSVISDMGATALAKALENSTLSQLQLSGNLIGDKGALELAHALEEDSMLTSLELSYSEITEVGSVALAKA